MDNDSTGPETLDAAIAKVESYGKRGQVFGTLRDRIPACQTCDNFLAHIALLLEQNGDTDYAKKLFLGVCRQATEHNRPVSALLAIRHLANLQQPTHDLLKQLADRYLMNSYGVMPGTAPEPLSCVLGSESFVVSDDIQIGDLVIEALDICGLQSHHPTNPTIGIGYSPIPILSELEFDDFEKLTDGLQVQLLHRGQQLVDMGQVNPGIWWIGQGSFSILDSNQKHHRIDGTHLVLGLDSMYGLPSRVAITCRVTCESLFLPFQTMFDLFSTSESIASVFHNAYYRGEIHRAFTHCPLFAHLSKEEHATVLSQCTGHQVSAGETLVRQGRISPGLYVIVQGEVLLELTKGHEKKSIRILQMGDVAGALGLGSSERSPLSAVAQSDVYVVFLDSKNIRSTFDACPALEAAFQRLQRKRATEVLHAVSE